MKSILEQHPEPARYPYLGALFSGEKTSYVVLFMAPGAGVLVYAGAGALGSVGEDGHHWHEPSFRPLVGSVVLSND